MGIAAVKVHYFLCVIFHNKNGTKNVPEEEFGIVLEFFFVESMKWPGTVISIRSANHNIFDEICQHNGPVDVHSSATKHMAWSA